MAVEIVKHVVCDMCGSREAPRSYRLTLIGAGKSATPDLCEECAQPIAAIIDRAKSKKRGGQPKPHVVRTEEEIARLAASTKRRRS